MMFDKAYLYDLMKYNRILKMRNQILKSLDSHESKVEQLKLFTPQLIDTAERIIEKRLKFIENINNIAKNIHKIITIDENLDISYSYSMKENLSIKEFLTFLNIKSSIVIDFKRDLKLNESSFKFSKTFLK